VIPSIRSSAGIVFWCSSLLPGALKVSGHGRCAGGALCVSRQLCERRPFRDAVRVMDWWCLQGHPSAPIKICKPGLYMLVRRQIGRLWTKLEGLDVTGCFARRLAYHKTLQDCLSTEDQEFCRPLKGRRTRSRDSASIIPAVYHGQRQTSGGAIMTPVPASSADSLRAGISPAFAR
jgi:hypothetical protein